MSTLVCVWEDLKSFFGFLGDAGIPPMVVVPMAFAFPVFCGGFKGGQSEIEVKSM